MLSGRILCQNRIEDSGKTNYVQNLQTSATFEIVMVSVETQKIRC